MTTANYMVIDAVVYFAFSCWVFYYISSLTVDRMFAGRGGGGNSVQQHQQRLIVQQLQLGVKMNNIHPQILNLPLTDQTLRSIQQLLNLQQTYQHHHDQLMQVWYWLLSYLVCLVIPVAFPIHNSFFLNEQWRIFCTFDLVSLTRDSQ